VKQAKIHSFVETILNVVVGFIVAVVSQILVFPIFGIYVPLSSNLGIACFFTAISIIRGYVLRRIFTNITGG
jgi:hypothetical protein